MADKIYYLDNSKNKYNKKKNKRKKGLFILLLIILFFILFFIFRGERTDIVTASYGEIVDGFETDALLIRDESAFSSPYSGKLRALRSEGERIAYGEKIIKIENNNINNLHSRKSGLLSYKTDGLEEEISPPINRNIINNFSELESNYKDHSNNYISQGDTAYRIINNHQLYLMIKLSVEEADRYWENEVVFIRKEDDELLEGKITGIITKENKAFLEIKMKKFINEWLDQRWINIEFVKNIHRGIIIPEEAIFRQEEGRGVLIATNDGEFTFQRLEVITRIDGKAIVEGLEIGEQIVRNPHTINHGQRR